MNQSKRCRRDFPHTAKRLRETCPSEIAFVGSHRLSFTPLLLFSFILFGNLQKEKTALRMGPGRGAIAALQSHRSIPCITSHNPVLSSVLIRVPQA
jgi:hypothetical protein